jgi:replicative DNA helicase
MPHNVEAEAALLGALMIDNRLIDNLPPIQPTHFFEPLHGEIFDAIRMKVGRSELANPVTLKPYFDSHEAMQEVGGVAYLAQLTGSGAAVIGARDFADQILQLANLRALICISRKTIERCERTDIEDADAAAIAGDMETVISETLVSSEIRKSTVTFAQAFDELGEEYRAIENGAAQPGFTINRYHDWNAACGRMEPQDFILLGARPSMGKTGVGCTVALGAAEAGVGTDFLSLEMDRRKASRRIIAELLYDVDDPIPYEALTAGKLSMAQWRRFEAAKDAIANLPLTVSDPPVMYVEDVAPHIRKRQREFDKRGSKLQLVVLDYLGRLDTRRKFNGATETVSHISKTLKAAAKETNVALVALAQLSRALEQRENKRPMLADLRDSGSLEQDADTVVFLYREEYYLERAEPKHGTEKWDKWSDEISSVRDDLEIFSAKKREGALTKRVSKFLTRFQAVLDSNDPRVVGAPGLFNDDQGFPEARG